MTLIGAGRLTTALQAPRPRTTHGVHGVNGVSAVSHVEAQALGPGHVSVTVQSREAMSAPNKQTERLSTAMPQHAGQILETGAHALCHGKDNIFFSKNLQAY